MLDAPVSGGEGGAINATLSIMVGGKQEVFERCQPLFEALGKTITYCGPSGAGQTVKLCNQVLVSVTNLAVCEALVLAKKAGVSPPTMVEAVSGGAAASWQLLNLAPEDDAGRLPPRLQGLAPAEGPAPGPGGRARGRPAAAGDGAGQPALRRRCRRTASRSEGTQALVKALEKLGDVTVEG